MAAGRRKLFGRDFEEDVDETRILARDEARVGDSTVVIRRATTRVVLFYQFALSGDFPIIAEMNFGENIQVSNFVAWGANQTLRGCEPSSVRTRSSVEAAECALTKPDDNA